MICCYPLLLSVATTKVCYPLGCRLECCFRGTIGDTEGARDTKRASGKDKYVLFLDKLMRKFHIVLNVVMIETIQIQSDDCIHGTLWWSDNAQTVTVVQL